MAGATGSRKRRKSADGRAGSSLIAGGRDRCFLRRADRLDRSASEQARQTVAAGGRSVSEREPPPSNETTRRGRRVAVRSAG